MHLTSIYFDLLKKVPCEMYLSLYSPSVPWGINYYTTREN